jgi:phosphoglycolate phosphatase-like HAD superfamily hydrolase
MTPANEEELLRALRVLDGHLGTLLGTYEYDFKILSVAAVHLFSGSLNYEQAAEEALSNRAGKEPEIHMIARNAFRAFRSKLSEIPKLYPEAKQVLSSLLPLRKSPRFVFTVLLSEGDQKRLRRVLRAHNMDKKQFFDEIFIRSKSRAAFEEAGKLARGVLTTVNGQEPLKIAIGDSIQRDIRFANEAGFLTIYKPSGYKGVEKPKSEVERPTYRIDKLAELEGILMHLGLPMRRAGKLPAH